MEGRNAGAGALVPGTSAGSSPLLRLGVRGGKVAEFDCIVIGGGPAGLTAAIYLARFHLSVAVFDDGRSRAGLIPLTRNLPGYPVGVGGRDLLRRMRVQAEGFGARMLADTVDSVTPHAGGFDVSAAGRELRATKLLLATGVVNLAPAMTHEEHDDALRRGLLRYCPICDGHEVTDHSVALLGSGAHGVAEAQFLRSYSERVTLILPHGSHGLDDAQRQTLAGWDIAVLDGPAEKITAARDDIAVQVAGEEHRFDTLYSALGTAIRSELARTAGAQTSQDGAILVDRHQMTSLAGLYAAGDVVKGLDQIATAMGQAAIAATAMRNAICEERPLKRGASSQPLAAASAREG
jgi:thioredoxin reductase (NADPH)